MGNSRFLIGHSGPTGLLPTEKLKFSTFPRLSGFAGIVTLENSVSIVIVFVVAFASVAAFSGCSARRYCVRRAAVVPSPAPSYRPAIQATGPVEAGISSDTMVFAKRPKKLAGKNVGLYVPREQMGGYLLFSPHPAVSIGTSFEYGLGSGAIPISKGLIDPPDSGVGGGGLSFSLHFKVTPMVTLDWASDIWGYAIPSQIAYKSSDDCENETTIDDTWDRKMVTSRVMIVRSQVSAGLDFGWSHFTVGLGIRNHPHNTDATVETHIDDSKIGPKLDHAAYPYIVLGWEIHLAEWAHVTVGTYQALNFDPVIYSPTVGVSFRMNTVGDKYGRDRGDDPQGMEPEPPLHPIPGRPPRHEQDHGDGYDHHRREGRGYRDNRFKDRREEDRRYEERREKDRYEERREKDRREEVKPKENSGPEEQPQHREDGEKEGTERGHDYGEEPI